MDERIYTKALVARYSPKNKCCVTDGTLLFVEPGKATSANRDVDHFFLSTADQKTRSKYGWVKRVRPFTFSEFVSANLANRVISDQERIHLEIMFRMIDRLDEGMPVAATYSVRGVEEKMLEFTVHRVVFHGV